MNDEVNSGLHTQLNRINADDLCRVCGLYQSVRTRGNRKITICDPCNFTYTSWSRMKERCNNPNSDDYKRYGSRGITVSPHWNNSFSNFFQDMGHRPNGHTLGRINNNGHYEPTNCRWESVRSQNLNKSTSRLITINNVTQNLCEWSSQYNIPTSTLRNRLRLGWSGERLLSEKSSNNLELNEDKINQIITLYIKGVSRIKISKTLKISTSTVHKYITTHNST